MPILSVPCAGSPVLPGVPSRGATCLGAVFLALAIVAFWPPPLIGQAPPDTLRLSDAVAEALRANPSLAAARLAADAAQDRIAPWPARCRTRRFRSP